MKRIATPHSWMLSKLGGKWATRPSTGPHRLRESLPLSIVIQNRLRYAMNNQEVKLILNDKEGLVKVLESEICNERWTIKSGRTTGSPLA